MLRYPDRTRRLLATRRRATASVLTLTTTMVPAVEPHLRTAEPASDVLRCAINNSSRTFTATCSE